MKIRSLWLVLHVDGYDEANIPFSVLVGTCHYGMARPQFADRGTASDKEGICE